MKTKTKKRVGFWQDMLSGANGGVSSKRVLGSVILMVLLVVIVVNTFIGADNHWLGEAFITMLVGAFSLLGIGVFEKRHLSKTEPDDGDVQDENFEE